MKRFKKPSRNITIFLTLLIVLVTGALILIYNVSDGWSNFMLGVQAFATLLLAVVAIFQDWIRSVFSKAELDLMINNISEYYQKTEMRQSTDGKFTGKTADAYVLRLKVKNIGNQTAKLVEVIAHDLMRKNADDVFVRVDSFLPMNLTWSHFPNRLYIDVIAPDLVKLFDLFHVVDPAKRTDFPQQDESFDDLPAEKSIICFDTITKPFSKNYLQPPGTYRLTVTAAASNAKPQSITLEIYLSGQWSDDDEQMLEEEINLSIA